ncbi:hypothetical protein [Streptomyces sp. NPDC048644]|uniref:hypothetical protein n=1 Tax=Streptomyces sp. NPDC048644 TaxID=3365582 RepID=UPI003724827E
MAAVRKVSKTALSGRIRGERDGCRRGGAGFAAVNGAVSVREKADWSEPVNHLINSLWKTSVDNAPQVAVGGGPLSRAAAR